MMNSPVITKRLLFTGIITLIISIAGNTQTNFDITKAKKLIRARDIKEYTTVLASDDFMGRKPGTPGGKKTVDYIVNELRGLGIEPGVNDSSYQQEIEFVNYTFKGEVELSSNAGMINLSAPESTLFVGEQSSSSIEFMENNMIFLGEGKDIENININLKGKVVLLISYSWESTKPVLVLLKSLGVKAALLINEMSFGEDELSYDLLSNSMWEYVFVRGTKEELYYPVNGFWVGRKTAAEILKINSISYDEIKKDIAEGNFEPIKLDCKIQGGFIKEEVSFYSSNVIGKIEGTDPDLQDEHIVYTAHWDHVGVDPGNKTDSIFNGASDNAVGVASLISVGKGFKSVKPKRSILLVFTTAEEIGILGSKYFTLNPVVPLGKISANINIDGVSKYGSTKDIIIIGQGYNTIEDVALEVAEMQGRYIAPEFYPEENFYLRSDHYPFAENGIPALFASGGVDHARKGKEYGEQMFEEDLNKHYHQPSDEINSSWEWDGSELDAEFFFLVGYKLANQISKPVWKETCPYPEFQERWLELQKE